MFLNPKTGQPTWVFWSSWGVLLFLTLVYARYPSSPSQEPLPPYLAPSAAPATPTVPAPTASAPAPSYSSLTSLPPGAIETMVRRDTAPLCNQPSDFARDTRYGFIEQKMETYGHPFPEWEDHTGCSQVQFGSYIVALDVQDRQLENSDIVPVVYRWLDDDNPTLTVVWHERRGYMRWGDLMSSQERR